MKTLITATILLFTTTAYGQFSIPEVNTFANEIVETHDGYINSYEADGKYEYAIVNIPSVYNFDLVRSMTSVVISRYADVETVNPWRVTDDNIRQTTIQVSNHYVVIGYYDDVLMIFAKKQ